MKRLNKILFALALFFGAGCELVVNVDLPEHEPQIVLNARLLEGSPMLIDLTESKPVLDDSIGYFEIIKDAEVRIVRNDQDTFDLVFFQAVKKYTNSGIILEAGDKYEVTVSHPDYNDVRAVMRVPIPVEITNLEIEKDVETDMDGNSLSRARFQIQDPPGEENFYSLLVGTIDSGMVSSSICYQSSAPVLSGQTDPLSGQRRPEYCGGDNFTDNLMTSSPYQMEIYFIDEYFRGVDSFFVRLTTYEESSYLYNISLREQVDNTGNPFAEPVIVYNNIENGLGIFGSWSVFEKQVKW